MSVRVLSVTPRAALFGKLPAHGDFIRRGDPDLVRRLDTWLTAEIERFAMVAGEDTDARLADLPTWCFRLPGDITGALTASRDKVGRIYPIVASTDAPTGGAELIAGLLADARDKGLDADETSARLIAVATDGACEDAALETEGWWRVSEPALLPASGAMPTGADFVRLLGAEG